MPKEEYVSAKIQITRTELNKAVKALGINVPIYTAHKHGRIITIVTRLGAHTYPPTKTKAKKVRT